MTTQRSEIELLTVKLDILSLKQIIAQNLLKICSDHHRELLIKLDLLLDILYESKSIIPTIGHIDRLRLLVLNGDNVSIKEELYAFNKLLKGRRI